MECQESREKKGMQVKVNSLCQVEMCSSKQIEFKVKGIKRKRDRSSVERQIEDGVLLENGKVKGVTKKEERDKDI